jgi:3-oxoacyl-[acyl-carrier-protein] synthase III
MRAIITGVGHYVPDKILSNSDLEKMGLDPTAG